MAKPGRIIIDHEDALAAMATWWKAVFLTPIWAFLVIMPLGALLRAVLPAFEVPCYFLILGLGVVYFVHDMAKRRIVIDENKIQFGFTSAPLAELESIDLFATDTTAESAYFRPRFLNLRFKTGKTMHFVLGRLSNDGLEKLIEILSRRVSHCKIDPMVETVLRHRKPETILRLENPDRLEAEYKSTRILDELPQVLKNTVYSWARLVGPIGTFILCTPLWLTFNLLLYHILHNYADIGANQQFYDALVGYLMPVIGAANHSLMVGSKFSQAVVASPVMAWLCSAAIIYGIYYLAIYVLGSMLGANRLTVNCDEISLDRFFDLFSFTDQSADWQDVYHVLLDQPKGSADPNKALIRFTDKNNLTIMTIAMASLALRDRERLSLASIKFGGRVASNLTEALEHSQDRSYTELWLKSLSDAPGRKNLEPLASGHLLENCRYEVEKKLAVGGEGVAYLGRDLKDLAGGKIEHVVLKETLIPPFVDRQVQQKALERFEREARMLQELKSEYVVGLRDYFIEDHRCYLVLDYVEGNNLRQYIAQHGHLAENEVLDLTKQMCAMLAFLHDRAVIHRDFTPDNLIFQKDGRLKLIDFNVAKESDDGKTGTIVGKHAYVPPEQFRGKPTKQSDIYAMGATLYFLLVGEDPEPITQSSPMTKNNYVSSAMDSLVRQCTTLEVTKRIQSVAEVVSTCEAISQLEQKTHASMDVDSEPPDNAPMTISMPLPEKSRKHKLKAARKEKAN